MSELAYHDFRSFIEEAKKISDYRVIEDADWDGEIGALTWGAIFGTESVPARKRTGSFEALKC